MKNNLYKLRVEKGYTQQKLANLLNISQQAYQRYENINPQTISPDTLIKLSEFYGISLNYLLGLETKATRQGVKIPVLGIIPAGIPIEAIEDILDYEEIPLELANTGEFFGLKVKGDSMSPRIQNGDVVIVKKQDTCESGDVCVVMVNGYEATLKQVKKDYNGIWIVPFNPEYKPTFYDNKEIQSLPIRIVGKVVELRGKF